MLAAALMKGDSFNKRHEAASSNSAGLKLSDQYKVYRYGMDVIEFSTIKLADYFQFAAMVESSRSLPPDGPAPRYLHSQ